MSSHGSLDAARRSGHRLARHVRWLHLGRGEERFSAQVLDFSPIRRLHHRNQHNNMLGKAAW